jgi:thiol:disulfide interchange protein DsbC
MIYKLLKIFFIAFSILIAGCDVKANDEEVRTSLETVEEKLKEMLPESVKLLSVKNTGITGYFEVNFEGIEPLYVSEDGEYLISGDIYQITKAGLVNKSEARKDFQRISALENLNKTEFITFQPEDIKHVVYVFTDVDCGYCRQFHSQIEGYLDLGIEVNYLAYPRAGIDSESYKKITSAWCSTNPKESLTTLKLGSDINISLCDGNPVEKHYKMGSSMGIQGTPSIITDKGKLIPGYLPPQDLLNQLNSNS